MIKRYLNSVSKLQAIMAKIVEGTAPEKFTTQHLKNIGFGSSNDRAVIPLLKDLGFLSTDGVPTQSYHDYRNASRSKKVLGQALKEAYPEIFHIAAIPSQSDKEAIKGLCKSAHNASDQVAGFMANTFLTLLEISDITGSENGEVEQESPETVETAERKDTRTVVEGVENPPVPRHLMANLRYNIEIHLPATKEIEVYNAIFKSLKEHLIDE